MSTSQLELIGVTQADRDRGYDTAVAIATASGEVLIAVGNAVGVVQGSYDAARNGVNVKNGAQVTAGLLGLGANTRAATTLTTSRAQGHIPTVHFQVGKHSEMPTPRPGQHSHHGVMSAWMKKVYPRYDAKKAPAVLMPDNNHRSTYSAYLKWRADIRRKSEGSFDWSKVSEADMRALSEKMFDAAQVPASIRKQYWLEFERMKAKLGR